MPVRYKLTPFNILDYFTLWVSIIHNFKKSMQNLNIITTPCLEIKITVYEKPPTQKTSGAKR